jgi:inner membrane protein
MDPLTHGITGSMASLTISEPENKKRAAIIGFGAAMLADIEAFIQWPGDPLFNLEIHRQFTHSLIFIPFGALIAASVFAFIFRKKLNFQTVYLFSFAGYATHWLMDLITSYGTEILWPFLDTRYALNIVSVVDPVITLGLLTFTGLALFKTRRPNLLLAWCWLLLFLSYGWVQNSRAYTAMTELVADRGHVIDKAVVKPTIGNQMLWRATYVDGDSVYTDAVRTGVLSSVKIYKGESTPLIQVSQDFRSFRGTTLYNDLMRFSRLSDGILVRHPNRPDIIGDGAYSMLPTSLVPLWGVEADTSQASQHVSFLYFRDASDEIREPFMDMLLGRNHTDRQ